jgi:hypothetical protein
VSHPPRARHEKPRRRRGVWSLFPALGGAVSYVALYLVLQPWLNESSDVSFFLAVGLLTLVLGFTAFAFVRAIWGPRPKTRSPFASGDRAARGEPDGEDDDETHSKFIH